MNLLIKLIGEERLCDIYRKHAAKQIRKGMVAEFQDDQGRWYYSIKDVEYTPITRPTEAQTAIQYLAAGMTGDSFEAAMNTLTACIANNDMLGAGAIVSDLLEFKKKVINFDAIVNIIAVNYIREDEDAIHISSAIHAEKCEFLKRETEAGRFFFRLPLLTSLLNGQTVSNEQLTQLYHHFTSELKSLKLKQDYYLTKNLPKESGQTEQHGQTS